MEALNIGSGLFILACFLLVLNVLYFVIECMHYLASTIIKRAFTYSFRNQMMLISVSFTYIMAYLFIW